MPFLDTSTLELKRSESRLSIGTPFWAVIHDLTKGGAPIEVRFAHGQPGNALRKPISTHLDDLSDTHSRVARWRARRTRAGIELVFEGRLCSANGNPSSVRFRTVYVYTPYSIRREMTLVVPRGRQAARLAPLHTAVDSRFQHYACAADPYTKPGIFEHVIGPHYFAELVPIPAQRGNFFKDTRPPGWVTFSRAGGEGLQIVPTGNLATWDAPAGTEATGNYRLIRHADSVEVILDALSVPKPVRLPATLTFAVTIDLVNLPATNPRPRRMAMIGNPPFPGDKLLKAWANSGVEIIEIMEGTRWQGGRYTDHVTGARAWRKDTDRFWRMGAYPCYRNPEDMRDLDRLIATAHRCGMKVVPYTGLQAVHPEVPQFGANIRDWRQQYQPNSGTVYMAAGTYPGATYGGMVCPDSPGWRNYYLRFVRTLLDNHDFDGIYVDLASKVYCHNPRHGSARHGGLDGLWDVLGKIRKLLGPDKLLVAHKGDCNMMIPLSNLADQVVTMEGIKPGKDLKWKLTEIAPYLRGFPACFTTMIPAYPWYLANNPPVAQAAMQDGIAKGLLLGSIPFHLDIYWEPQAWGYRDNRQAIADPRGIFALFRKVKALNLDGLNFDDCFSKAVRTNRRGVLGARHYGKGREIIVVANVSGRTMRNIRWQSAERTGRIAKLAPSEYRFIVRKSAPGPRRTNRVAA